MSKKMLNSISQSPKWCLQIPSFVQPTAQNPKRQQILTFWKLETASVWQAFPHWEIILTELNLWIKMIP